MLFSELYKIMVNKGTILGIRGSYHPNRLPWILPWLHYLLFIVVQLTR